MGRELRGREDGGNVTNIQYKSNQNCHYKSPPTQNEYILIKLYLKNKVSFSIVWFQTQNPPASAPS
jgi:hypothetical protein